MPADPERVFVGILWRYSGRCVADSHLTNADDDPHTDGYLDAHALSHAHAHAHADLDTNPHPYAYAHAYAYADTSPDDRRNAPADVSWQ